MNIVNNLVIKGNLFFKLDNVKICFGIAKVNEANVPKNVVLPIEYNSKDFYILATDTSLATVQAYPFSNKSFTVCSSEKSLGISYMTIGY